MVYKFFDKKTAGGAVKNENMSDQQLAEELHKPIIIKFKKRKLYSSFIDNVWGTDLGDMQLISKVNRWIRFLFCVIDNFSKHAWLFPLKDKKGITITNVFQKSIYYRKPNKIWLDNGSEFCNRSMKSWLEKIQ